MSSRTSLRSAGRGSVSHAGGRRRTAAQEPVKRHDACAVCGGAVTFYPRHSDDVAPRSCSVDETQRWAHDELGDWLGRPHRAVPNGGLGPGTGARCSPRTSDIDGRSAK